MTTLIDQVAERIGLLVPQLTGAIDTVADLAALTAENAMPQREVTAFVVPLGFDDRGVKSATGLHTQTLNDTIGVVLCVKALGDAKARRALPTIDALKDGVISAVAGWSPISSIGVFAVSRGRLVSVTKGLVIYQLDFALLKQLRIATT